MAEGLVGRLGSWADDVGRNLPGGEDWSARREAQRQLEALQRQEQLKIARAALTTRNTTPEALLDSLVRAQQRTNQLNVDQLEATTPIMLGARGQAKQQDAAAYRAQSQADLARDSGLLGARTDATLRIMGGSMGDLERIRDENDNMRQDKFLRYATTENAASRELQNKQIDRSTTMGLISNILGAGLIAAALAA